MVVEVCRDGEWTCSIEGDEKSKDLPELAAWEDTIRASAPCAVGNPAARPGPRASRTFSGASSMPWMTVLITAEDFVAWLVVVAAS
jgi:hypothetical protein